MTILDFEGLPNLDSLKLGHNQITVLGPTVFKNLPRMSALELEYNGIKKVDVTAFNGLEGNSAIHISGTGNLREAAKIMSILPSLEQSQVRFSHFLPPTKTRWEKVSFYHISPRFGWLLSPSFLHFSHG